jgi:transcriptional regulator with XRE-family HTH domain
MIAVLDDNQAKLNIAANLSRLLDERGMTRYRLAQLTGENQSTLHDIIHGARLPKIGILARIAEALEVTIDDLVRVRSEANRDLSQHVA